MVKKIYILTFTLFFLIAISFGCVNFGRSDAKNDEKSIKTEYSHDDKLKIDSYYYEKYIAGEEEKITVKLKDYLKASDIYDSGEDVKFNYRDSEILPEIKLKIYEGPYYAEGNKICYYRIKAKVSGEPEPEIIFSRDDSKGAWGKDICQVNLKEGESYILKATAKNSAGESSDSITLNWIDKKEVGDIYRDIDYSKSYNFEIRVDLGKQLVTVYYKENIIKEMICSGGASETPTPAGNFTTSQKIYYSWLPRFDVGAYYFIRFYNTYLFHSVPFDEKGNLIEEEFEKLGTPASHGCIRLALEDAKWLYENLPLGVSVIIHE